MLRTPVTVTTMKTWLLYMQLLYTNAISPWTMKMPIYVHSFEGAILEKGNREGRSKTRMQRTFRCDNIPPFHCLGKREKTIEKDTRTKKKKEPAKCKRQKEKKNSGRSSEIKMSGDLWIWNKSYAGPRGQPFKRRYTEKKKTIVCEE